MITLGASLILINVGREIPRWGRLLIYIGFLGLTLGSSELLLRQLSGIGLGDRQVALTLLWIGWMYLYRGIASPLSAYLKLPQRHLHQLAHIHWGLGTVLLSLAATLPINQPPLALISGGLLTSYAILQSRQPHLTRNSRLWLYLGVAQGYGVLSISIAISGTQQQVLPFMGAIAVALALFLYHAPWSRWGWHPTPLASSITAVTGNGGSLDDSSCTSPECFGDRPLLRHPRPMGATNPLALSSSPSPLRFSCTRIASL